MGAGGEGGRLRQRMNEARSHRAGSLSLGLALCGVASVALYFSKDIRFTGLSAHGGVGPRAFPIGLGVCLLLGGIYEMACWLLAKPLAPANGSGGQLRPLESKSGGTVNVLLVLASLAIYIPAITWIGFSLSSWLFATALMTRLGNRLYWSALTSAALVAMIKLLFLYLFKVQLPDGNLGLPF